MRCKRSFVVSAAAAAAPRRLRGRFLPIRITDGEQRAVQTRGLRASLRARVNDVLERAPELYQIFQALFNRAKVVLRDLTGFCTAAITVS